VGRLRPDGCLVHLGRQNAQVKVHGFRVELAEVEQALLALAGVREAVVRIWEGQPEGQHVVAYLVPDSSPAPTASALRRALAERLPAAMIPATFVVLDALPLTPGGKVNHQALPPPGRARPRLETAFVAPRTPVEARVAGIWAEVLDLEQVGIHDGFLELGGDSLRASQVISRVRSAFQVELPLRALFEAPTVAGLAFHITESIKRGDVERLLARLDQLSDQEAHALLRDVFTQQELHE
jgi:acyl carrier protein